MTIAVGRGAIGLAETEGGVLPGAVLALTGEDVFAGLVVRGVLLLAGCVVGAGGFFEGFGLAALALPVVFGGMGLERPSNDLGYEWSPK